MHVPFVVTVLAFLALTVIAAPVVNLPTQIAAKPTIKAQDIVNAIRHANKTAIDSYPATQELNKNLTIYRLNVRGIKVVVFSAGMAVDCDGARNCPDNNDFQPQTSFGRLDAYLTPYYVVPQRFFDNYRDENNQKMKPNAVGAMIYKDKILYGIAGDTNGDEPQVMGEASIGLAKAFFPNEHISGANGHVQDDILYIVFPQEVPPGVHPDAPTINLPALKASGDKMMEKLATGLNE